MSWMTILMLQGTHRASRARWVLTVEAWHRRGRKIGTAAAFFVELGAPVAGGDVGDFLHHKGR
jgi:hypothetical protein